MKITLVIDDQVMERLRAEGTRQGRTLSELVEAGLRLLLDRQPETKSLPKLPTFHGGGLLVEIADRDALDTALEDD
jgi:hypothetical protein